MFHGRHPYRYRDGQAKVSTHDPTNPDAPYRPWAGIQACLEELDNAVAASRARWVLIGKALLEGRALYPADRAFSAWCVNEGFDMRPNHRTDAMWLASNWSTIIVNLPEGLTHPEGLRKAHRDLQASQAPSPDLDISAPADVALERIAKVAPNARRVTALAAHAAGTGPEAATARKYLSKQAADKGMTVGRDNVTELLFL